MKIVGLDMLHRFMRKHSDTKSWISCWIAEVEDATWQTPNDIKQRYGKVSFLAENVVIFDVKGNSYRLEVQIAYRTQIVDVVWAGTHSEYDERNKRR